MEFEFDDYPTRRELCREVLELFADYDPEGDELVAQEAYDLGADWRTDPDELRELYQEEV